MKQDQQRTAELIATASAIAMATTALGEAVRYENTENWTWDRSLLDVTLASDAQSFGGVADVTGTSIYLDYFSDFYPAFSYSTSFTSGDGAEIFNSGFSNRYAAPLLSGDHIGPGMTDGEFSVNSTVEFVWSSYDYYTGYSDSGSRGILPSGEDVYLGVRLDIAGSTHYGWIGVNRSGTSLQVTAWGYETEAGVGVSAGVPTPGPLGLLAVGAVGALKRKKRAG